MFRSSYTCVSGPVPGPNPTIPGMFSNMFPLGTAQVVNFFLRGPRFDIFTYYNFCLFFMVLVICSNLALYLLCLSKQWLSRFADQLLCCSFCLHLLADQSFNYVQATRHARRVYVGGLPPTANEQVYHTLIHFTSSILFWINGLLILIMHFLCSLLQPFSARLWQL